MQKFLLNMSLIALALYSGTAITLAQKEANKTWMSTVYTTAENTSLKISQTGTLQFHTAQQPIEKDIWVFVDPSQKYQSIVGIGGAITDAAAETFAKLPESTQKELLTAFYDSKNGLGYSIIRTNIGSCDFSSDSYSYVARNDEQLKTFNVSHDEKYKIPLIKKAIITAGGTLPLFVSPWSPPAWIKDNDDLLHGGKLLPKYRQLWANYLVKFIKTYEQKGMPIWGLSVQNEPMAIQRWESCIFTAEEERDFIKGFIGPTLERSGLKNIKLLAWDHNRDLLYHRASTIMEDPQAAKYIWGFGYHWYETWSGSGMQFENLKRVKEAFPTKNLLFSEGCIEKYDASKINEWWLGERYGTAMINDFNNGNSGWIDWNILLDQNGGPNHAGNFCYAPVHADTNTGKLTYTNIFYYQGHFSKFVKPGAKRIACATTRDQLLATAFINKDGKVAVITMNPTDRTMDCNLFIEGVTAPVKLLPHSISTLIIEGCK
jgi:glucosylceramidase